MLSPLQGMGVACLARRATPRGRPLPPLLPAAPAGEVPFEVPATAPPQLADLMARCIRRDPAERPSFERILEVLSAIAQQLPRLAPAEEQPRPAGGGAAAGASAVACVPGSSSATATPTPRSPFASD